MGRYTNKHFLVAAGILALLSAEIKVNSALTVPTTTEEGYVTVTDGPELFETTEEGYVTDGPELFETTEEGYVTDGPELFETTEEGYVTDSPDLLETTEEGYVTDGPDLLVTTEEGYVTDGPNLLVTTEEGYVTDGPDLLVTTEEGYVTDGPNLLVTTEEGYVTDGPDLLVATEEEHITHGPNPPSKTTAKEYTAAAGTIPFSTTTKDSEHSFPIESTKCRDLWIFLIIIGTLTVLCTILLVSSIALAYQVSDLKANLKRRRSRSNSDFVKTASLWSTGPSKLAAEQAETNVMLEEVRPLKDEEDRPLKDKEEVKPSQE